MDGVLVKWNDCDGCSTPSDPYGEWFDQTLWVGVSQSRITTPPPLPFKITTPLPFKSQPLPLPFKLQHLPLPFKIVPRTAI